MDKNIETILIAEDNTIVRRAAARLLERTGYMVLEARDGREALQVVCNYPGTIHLLYTDMVMPEMNGRQLADVSQAVRPGLKVLYTSAFTDRMLFIRGVLESGLAFIDKSAAPEEICRKVREVLDSSETTISTSAN